MIFAALVQAARAESSDRLVGHYSMRGSHPWGLSINSDRTFLFVSSNALGEEAVSGVWMWDGHQLVLAVGKPGEHATLFKVFSVDEKDSSIRLHWVAPEPYLALSVLAQRKDGPVTVDDVVNGKAVLMPPIEFILEKMPNPSAQPAATGHSTP